jgi:hypothetical protein
MLVFLFLSGDEEGRQEFHLHGEYKYLDICISTLDLYGMICLIIQDEIQCFNFIMNSFNNIWKYVTAKNQIGENCTSNSVCIFL